MFAVLWFLFIAFALTFSLSWLLDHNGDVLITWLGYQVQSDVLTAILLTTLFSVLLFVISYIIARLLAVRFPTLLKILFRRSYVRHLEKVIKRHHKAFATLTKSMLALEAGDDRTAKKLQKEFKNLTKYSALNDFITAKTFMLDHQYSKAAEVFEKFGENRHAKILVLECRMENALRKHEDVKAMAYAKQILALQKDNLVIARKLYGLYKKAGMQAEAADMVLRYGDTDLNSNDDRRIARKTSFFSKIKTFFGFKND